MEAVVESPGRRTSPWVQSIPTPFRRSPLAVTAAAVVAAWLALAAAAPALAPYEPLEQDIAGRLAPPTASHWLGTDALGRDVASRILYGARISIPVGMGAVILAALLGTLVGALAGFVGGVADEATMRVTDLMLAFPTVILALVITAALGAGIRNAVIAIMIAWWPSYARLVRGLVLAVREREYVQAAYSLGASAPRVLALDPAEHGLLGGGHRHPRRRAGDPDVRLAE